MKTAKRVSSAPKLIEGKHPLVVIRDASNLEELYRALGHANHTSVSAYTQRARKDKKLVIPAEWCLTLSRISGIALADLRPDVYAPEHKVKRESLSPVKAKASKPAKPVKAAPKAKASKPTKAKRVRKVKAEPLVDTSDPVVDSSIVQE